MVLARATVRDMYEGVRVARELSRMAAIMAIAPLVAPLTGGVLQTAVRLALELRRAVLFAGDGLDHGVVAAAGDVAAARAGAVFARLDAALLSPLSGDRGFVVHLGIGDLLHGRAVLLDIRARPSCCRTSTASRRWRSALAFAIASGGYLIGTASPRRCVTRWGSGRTMGFGTRRHGDAAVLPWCWRWRSACTWRSALVLAAGALHGRHGHGVAASAGRRIAAVPRPRRRRGVAVRLCARRPRRPSSARSSATCSATPPGRWRSRWRWPDASRFCCGC